MSELREEAKEYIKQHSIERISRHDVMTSLSAMCMSASVDNRFNIEERRQIIDLIQKSYYINEILVWKIYAFSAELREMRNEFKCLTDKWEYLEAQINIYNKNVLKGNLFAQAKELINVVAKGFTNVTEFKGGKLQLQNRPIQRTFEKLRNKCAKRLNFLYLVAYCLDKFIRENDISEFISERIKEAIQLFSADLAHDPKYSATYWANEEARGGDNAEIKKHKRYAIYPLQPTMATIGYNERDIRLTQSYLFSGLDYFSRHTQI